MLRLFDFPGVLQAFANSDGLDGIEVNVDSMGKLHIPELLKESFYEAETEWRDLANSTVADCLGSALARKVFGNDPVAAKTLRELAILEPCVATEMVGEIRGRPWKGLVGLIADWQSCELVWD